MEEQTRETIVILTSIPLFLLIVFVFPFQVTMAAGLIFGALMIIRETRQKDYATAAVYLVLLAVIAFMAIKPLLGLSLIKPLIVEEIVKGVALTVAIEHFIEWIWLLFTFMIAYVIMWVYSLVMRTSHQVKWGRYIGILGLTIYFLVILIDMFSISDFGDAVIDIVGWFTLPLELYYTYQIMAGIMAAYMFITQFLGGIAGDIG